LILLLIYKYIYIFISENILFLNIGYIYILYLKINIFGNNLPVIRLCTLLKTFPGLKTFSEEGVWWVKKKIFNLFDLKRKVK